MVTFQMHLDILSLVAPIVTQYTLMGFDGEVVYQMFTNVIACFELSATMWTGKDDSAVHVIFVKPELLLAVETITALITHHILRFVVFRCNVFSQS